MNCLYQTIFKWPRFIRCDYSIETFYDENRINILVFTCHVMVKYVLVKCSFLVNYFLTDVKVSKMYINISFFDATLLIFVAFHKKYKSSYLFWSILWYWEKLFACKRFKAFVPINWLSTQFSSYSFYSFNSYLVFILFEFYF